MFHADTLHMVEISLEMPQESAEGIGVLAAYRAEQLVRKQMDPEHEGWIDRLTRIPGLEDEQLSSIHGRLIAFGLLKFQLTNRTTGVQYQLSSAGLKTLERAAERPVDAPAENVADDAEREAEVQVQADEHIAENAERDAA